MKLKFVLPLAMIFFMTSMSAFAGGIVEIKGQVLRIDKSVAVIVTDKGEEHLPLKSLSRQDAKRVMQARGTSSQITVKVAPESLIRR